MSFFPMGRKNLGKGGNRFEEECPVTYIAVWQWYVVTANTDASVFELLRHGP